MQSEESFNGFPEAAARSERSSVRFGWGVSSLRELLWGETYLFQCACPTLWAQPGRRAHRKTQLPLLCLSAKVSMQSHFNSCTLISHQALFSLGDNHNLSVCFSASARLKTVDVLMRSLQAAESQVKKYESRLSEEDIVPADTVAIQALGEQLKVRWSDTSHIYSYQLTKISTKPANHRCNIC